MSTRPSFQSAQRFLIIGILAGIIFGIILGFIISYVYIVQNPPVYQGGAFPDELTEAYQNHYKAMVVDSYIVNQEPEVAVERMKRFDPQAQILILGERSAAYVAAGRGVEAQLINNLAVTLKNSQGWDDETIKAAIAELTERYQTDPARSQAISTFSAQLLNGQVPVPAPSTEPDSGAAATPQVPAVPPAAPGSIPWLGVLLCCLALLVALVLGLLIFNRMSSKKSAKPQIVWEGEGRPPLKQWRGTYTLGQDNYDEFFTIETEDGDFMGESGIGIMDSKPGTSPKEVWSFDVGLFDKTDITTLSRVVMSDHAFNDETLRAKVEANPQAEAILAEPGKKFSFDTTALRVDAEVEEVEYGDDEKTFFSKLTANLKVFLKEGADIRRGEMDIPDEFKS
ncbi:MAG: hypothetical protein KDI62_01120 [Anaerolineae bacterium]|nr:hypothetical protein [Anaerolineae bacterium]